MPPRSELRITKRAVDALTVSNVNRRANVTPEGVNIPRRMTSEARHRQAGDVQTDSST